MITRANQILSVYEKTEAKRDLKIQEALPIDELIPKEDSKVEKRLDEIDPLSVTPLEALNLLNELKELRKE